MTRCLGNIDHIRTSSILDERKVPGSDWGEDLEVHTWESIAGNSEQSKHNQFSSVSGTRSPLIRFHFKVTWSSLSRMLTELDQTPAPRQLRAATLLA